MSVKQEIVGYKSTLKNLEYAIEKNIPALLIGETGVGKTSLIRHLSQKHSKTFRRINLNGQTTIDEFVGKTLLNNKGTYWQDGVLTEAMRNGWWLLLDEINAALPEVLMVLHSLLDDDRFIVLSEKDGEVVLPHKDFRVFATMNPSGRYAGAKDLNKALFSRFAMVLQLDFPSAKQEMDIIKHYAPKCTRLNREKLVKMARQMRESYKKGEMEMVVSTRDLINCAKMSVDMSIKKAVNIAIINRANEDDVTSVQTLSDLYFGKENTYKTKDVQMQEFMTSTIRIADESENFAEIVHRELIEVEKCLRTMELFLMENKLHTNFLDSLKIRNKDLLYATTNFKTSTASHKAAIKNVVDKVSKE